MTNKKTESQHATKSHALPSLPRINLYHLKEQSMQNRRLNFTPRSARIVEKKIMQQLKQSENKMVQSARIIRQANWSRIKGKPTAKSSDLTKQKKNMPNICEVVRRFEAIKRFFIHQKLEMDNILVKELERKSENRPDAYIKRCISLEIKGVNWEDVIDYMNKKVSEKQKSEFEQERREARRMWFNNFVYMLEITNK